ncbi:hypothetical protein HY496_01375 [Candidatus Woesearchaeota archaeon]|nr:hypothetical protein [Candidatus Woesearchaeota archaeon]
MRNTKAMMDDLFDFLFTVLVAFFALLFIHAALVKSIDDRNQNSLTEMTSVNQIATQIVDQQKHFEQGNDPLLGFKEQMNQKKITLPLKAAKPEGTVSTEGFQDE